MTKVTIVNSWQRWPKARVRHKVLSLVGRVIKSHPSYADDCGFLLVAIGTGSELLVSVSQHRVTVLLLLGCTYVMNVLGAFREERNATLLSLILFITLAQRARATITIDHRNLAHASLLLCALQ
jgi:hypothetical protein